MKQLSREHILLTLLLGVFFTIFITVSFHRYWQYSAWYYDFGIFYGAISAVAQGREPIIDHFIFTDKNILGDHFHPIIFLISPFVAVFQGGETLLFFQTLFVTLSGIFVYLTAREILKKKFEAFSILLMYLSFIGLHNALITEFHEIALLPLPLSIFFYGMVKKNSRWYFLGLLGTLLTKESTFIIPSWFGLLLFFQNRGLWRKIGFATVLGSVVYGLTVIFVVIPAINGSGYFYLSDTLQKSSSGIAIDALTFQSIMKTLLGFGFLPLLAPETLVPVFFNWYSRISRFGNFDLGMHYNAEIAPTLAFAAMYGWQRARLLVSRFFKKYLLLKYLSFALFFLALFSLFFNIYVLKSPALLFINRDFYQNTTNHAFLDTLLEQIPEDGVVMAQTNIAAKLAYRKVYMLRENYSDFDPDYIVIDTRAGQEPNIFWGIFDFQKLVTDLQADANYELFYTQGEQSIYKKVAH